MLNLLKYLLCLLTPNEGEIEDLTKILSEDLVLRLYTNDKTPANTDTVADYTECAAAGYVAKTLTGGSWSISSIDSVATGTYADQLFQTSVTSLCYGVFVTNVAKTKIRWASRFVAPPDLPWDVFFGITIVPKKTLEQKA